MTPKQLFQSDKARARKQQEIASDPLIQQNLHTAFNEFCWSELPSCQHPERAMWANAMREGALKFISVFLHLGDQQEPRKNPATTGQLIDPDASYRKRHARPIGSESEPEPGRGT